MIRQVKKTFAITAYAVLCAVNLYGMQQGQGFNFGTGPNARQGLAQAINQEIQNAASNPQNVTPMIVRGAITKILQQRYPNTPFATDFDAQTQAFYAVLQPKNRPFAANPAMVTFRPNPSNFRYELHGLNPMEERHKLDANWEYIALQYCKTKYQSRQQRRGRNRGRNRKKGKKQQQQQQRVNLPPTQNWSLFDRNDQRVRLGRIKRQQRNRGRNKKKGRNRRNQQQDNDNGNPPDKRAQVLVMIHDLFPRKIDLLLETHGWVRNIREYRPGQKSGAQEVCIPGISFHINGGLVHSYEYGAFNFRIKQADGGQQTCIQRTFFNFHEGQFNEYINARPEGPMPGQQWGGPQRGSSWGGSWGGPQQGGPWGGSWGGPQQGGPIDWSQPGQSTWNRNPNFNPNQRWSWGWQDGPRFPPSGPRPFVPQPNSGYPLFVPGKTYDEVQRMVTTEGALFGKPVEDPEGDLEEKIRKQKAEDQIAVAHGEMSQEEADAFARMYEEEACGLPPLPRVTVPTLPRRRQARLLPPPRREDVPIMQQDGFYDLDEEDEEEEFTGPHMEPTAAELDLQRRLEKNGNPFAPQERKSSVYTDEAIPASFRAFLAAPSLYDPEEEGLWERRNRRIERALEAANTDEEIKRFLEGL